LPYPHYVKPTPNRDPLAVHERLGVCFHQSAETFPATLAAILKPDHKLSYHCLIDLNGTRCTFVLDEHVAWHASGASFRGRADCNDFLLGCAFAAGLARAPLTSDQIESALEWLDDRWSRYGWSPEWMTDHRQIAPQHPDDLNPVEWERLLGAIKERFVVA
jgi:AmpD protein